MGHGTIDLCDVRRGVEYVGKVDVAYTAQGAACKIMILRISGARDTHRGTSNLPKILVLVRVLLLILLLNVHY